MSESNDKELSIDELKDDSGGYNAGTNWIKKKSSFTELGKISLNLNDDIKRKESGEKFIWPDSEDRPPQDQ